MRRLFPLITVCLLVSAAAEPLFAQQRLFALTQLETVELDPRPASFGAVIRRFPIPGRATAEDILTPFRVGAPAKETVVSFGGGEFLASLGGDIALLNTRSGARERFDFPDFNATKVIGSDGNARLLILGTNESRHLLVLVADAHLGTTRFLDLGPERTAGAVAYAPASDVLFVARPRKINPLFASEFHDIDVMDVRSGALLKTMNISPVNASWSLATNAVGTRLFVRDLQTGTYAFDVPTGALSAANTSRPLALGPYIHFDEQRNRLVMDFEGMEAFSADSLQSLGKVNVADLPLPQATPPESPRFVHELDISGQSATIVMLQSVEVGYNYYPYTCHASRLVAIDAQTGDVRRAVDMATALGPDACYAKLVRITEPAPPPAPTADVAGRQVVVKWQAPFGATQYEIEAGSEPGLANLATIRVTDPQLVIDGVPTGAYYLRIRATNTIGKSAPSPDIPVVVQ